MLALTYAFFAAYLIYGIVHVARNKRLTKPEKLLWLILVVYMPAIGTSMYLRSTFVTRHGRW